MRTRKHSFTICAAKCDLKFRFALFTRESSEPNQIVQEYILPNFSERREGRIKGRDEILTDEEDVVRMGNERFAVPELLFRPSDIGKTLLWELVHHNACVQRYQRVVTNRSFWYNRKCNSLFTGRYTRPLLGKYHSHWGKC